MDERWYFCPRCRVHGRGGRCWSCHTTFLQTDTDEVENLASWASDQRLLRG